MHAAKVIVIGFLLAIPATSAAQDAGRVGITTGYPASIGVLWHVSERIAVRPQFSFTTTSSSSDSPLITASTDFSTLGSEVSVLFYSPVRDNLKLYVAPRFAYSRTSGSSDVSESTTNGYSVSGMFGGHYALGRRFALFGEAGFQYTRTTGTVSSLNLPALETSSRGDSSGTRTAVGVVIYF